MYSIFGMDESVKHPLKHKPIDDVLIALSGIKTDIKLIKQEIFFIKNYMKSAHIEKNSPEIIPAPPKEVEPVGWRLW